MPVPCTRIIREKAENDNGFASKEIAGGEVRKVEPLGGRDVLFMAILRASKEHSVELGLARAVKSYSERQVKAI